jgi:hypothetical protein
VKPPGIYGIFALAGRLFGFSEVGMHLFDLIWMLALAVILRVTLAGYFQRSWLSAILAWMTVGLYFSQIDPRQQMQVESLVNLPLYIVVWGLVQASQASQQRWRWLVMAGIAGGVLLLFKLIYLPMLVAFWLLYLLHACWRRRESLVAAIGESVWPALGVLFPIIPVMLYWQSQGVLNDAMYTIFQHPPLMMKELPKKSLQQLIFSLVWFVRKFAPLIVLMGYGAVKMRQRIDLLAALMWAWIVLGFGMILSQSLSWWSYHFLLLLVPVGILATKGLEIALRSSRQWGLRLAIVSLMGLLLCNVYSIGMIGQHMAQSGFLLSPASKVAYETRKFDRYAKSLTVANAFNRSPRRPGDIFVMGEPIIYHMVGRYQGIPLIGWITELLLEKQWPELINQIQSAQLPYIFIETDVISSPEIRQDLLKSFLDYLQQHYRAIEKTEVGVWYERNG